MLYDSIAPLRLGLASLGENVLLNILAGPVLSQGAAGWARLLVAYLSRSAFPSPAIFYLRCGGRSALALLFSRVSRGLLQRLPTLENGLRLPMVQR